MIRIVAPEGYKLYDIRTDKTYSEAVVDERERERFMLVPNPAEQIVTDERKQ